MIIQKRFSSVLHVIMFLLLLLLLLIQIQKIMVPKYYALTSEGETDKYAAFYHLPPNSVDYVTLGASHSYYSINPTVIYAISGQAGFALGSSAQSIKTSYYWLKEAFKTQSPEYIFFDVSYLVHNLKEDGVNLNFKAFLQMKPSWNKLEAMFVHKPENVSIWEYLIPLYKFHSRWNSLSQKDWAVKEDVQDYFLNGGVVNFHQVSNTEKEEYSNYHIINYFLDGTEIEEKMTVPEISEENQQYFDKILALCKAHNATLYPIKTPTKNWDDERAVIVRDFLSERGLALYDISKDSAVGIDWSADSQDSGGHCNYWGMNKTSAYLANTLFTELGLHDRRGDNIYAVWDRSQQLYTNWEEKKLLSSKMKAYSHLTKLINNKQYLVFLITIKDEGSLGWNNHLQKAVNDLGVSTSFYDKLQDSYIAVINGGENQFEKWDENQIMVSTEMYFDNGTIREINITSAGFTVGNRCSIQIDGKEYSLNSRGLNIVALDKRSGEVVSSVCIDTHTNDLTFNSKNMTGIVEESAEKEIEEPKIADGAQCIADGIYNIASYENSSYVLDVPFGSSNEDANIWLCDRNGLIPQQFKLNYIGNGLYTIEAICSGKYLAVEKMGSTSGSNVSQQDYTGLANQKWFIVPSLNETYSFISLYNGYVMDLEGDNAGYGTNIQVKDENFEPSQQFILEKVE